MTMAIPTYPWDTPEGRAEARRRALAPRAYPTPADEAAAAVAHRLRWQLAKRRKP